MVWLQNSECSIMTCLDHSTGEQVNWKQASVMTGYKRSIAERLRHPQARMGQRSPLCEQLRDQTVQQFKTTFLNKQLQGIQGFHHLQLIISSKNSENLEKSLHITNIDIHDLQSLWSHCIKN
ncbi:hypothetical protein AMECASPLE_011603 [Ameca splendens]|uniref:Uncharacterized protein n=1 Tax=Ameca splendens TaxID=208324 RepID=A0ABV0XPS8_9TELE